MFVRCWVLLLFLDVFTAKEKPCNRSDYNAFSVARQLVPNPNQLEVRADGFIIIAYEDARLVY